jgi:hypothetical protein
MLTELRAADLFGALAMRVWQKQNLTSQMPRTFTIENHYAEYF